MGSPEQRATRDKFSAASGLARGHATDGSSDPAGRGLGFLAHQPVTPKNVGVTPSEVTWPLWRQMGRNASKAIRLQPCQELRGDERELVGLVGRGQESGNESEGPG
ncbi:hypothetical protein P7K49_027690 [Saguinus oedipus]|uniref:Uncharacterized protein n=1 Tax=Saguinus oedipus TaxID=9490 RepID=A0ABQ9UCE6_SAGOE|nr:hypothetical protein P7K49_027690 [Saguinus oedipus]